MRFFAGVMCGMLLLVLAAFIADSWGPPKIHRQIDLPSGRRSGYLYVQETPAHSLQRLPSGT
jgi:hypothetical protein